MKLNINEYCSVEVIELDRRFTDYALEMNTSNRSVNKSRVNNYAADMKNGNWTFNGEPIIFTTDGRLIQGQHRLLAHKESGYVPGVVTLVIRLVLDYENKAFKTLDCGMKRSYGQVLNMEKVPNANSIAAIRRAICVVIRGCGNNPTVAMMEKVGLDYEREISSLMSAGINFSNFGKDSSKAGFVIAAKATKNVEMVAEFVHRVAIGAELKNESPELAYKRFLDNYKIVGGNSLSVHISVACKCVLAYMHGQQMSFCRTSLDGIEAIKKIAKDNGVEL